MPSYDSPTVLLYVEVLVLVGAAWPIWMPCLSRSFRRAYPENFLKLVGLLLLYIALLVILLLTVPVALHILAPCAAMVFLGERWMARPSYGTSRGLPPGSLGYARSAAWKDHLFLYKQGLRFGPIFKARYFLRPMVCVTDLKQGMTILQEHRDCLKSPEFHYYRFIPKGFIRSLGGDDHKTYRALLREALSNVALENSKEVICAEYRTALLELSDTCIKEPGRGAQPRSAVYDSLFRIWTYLFFGIRSDTQEFTHIDAWSRMIDSRKRSRLHDRRIHRALETFRGFLTDLAGEPNVRHSVLGELKRLAPDRTDDPVLLTNIIYLFHTTWSDVSGLLMYITKHLCGEPAWRDQLAEIPADRHEPGGLADRFIMETFRMGQSESITRKIIREFSWNNLVFSKGWLLRVRLKEAHRDASVYDEAHQFNPDRFLDKTYTSEEYCPFGAFEHACLGTAFTHEAGRLFIATLTSEFKISPVSDGPLEAGSWRIWRPSSRLRVHIEPRD